MHRALAAEQEIGRSFGRHVGGPACEQAADHAVLELEGGGDHIFGTIDHMRLRGLANRHHPLDVSDVVTQQIDVMDGVELQDAATGLGIAHPASRRATHCHVCANRLDLSELALVDEPFHRRGFARMTQLMRDHQGHSRLVGGFDHVAATLQRVRHRLLDEDMLAGLHRGDGAWHVCRVIRADVHRFDIGVAEHVVQIRVDGVDARVFRIVPRERLHHVAYGCETHPVGMREVGGHVISCDAAGA